MYVRVLPHNRRDTLFADSSRFMFCFILLYMYMYMYLWRQDFFIWGEPCMHGSSLCIVFYPCMCKACDRIGMHDPLCGRCCDGCVWCDCVLAFVGCSLSWVRLNTVWVSSEKFSRYCQNRFCFVHVYNCHAWSPISLCFLTNCYNQ